ncbi:stage V sporulation protein AB [Anaerosalibacter sp. Marseille-P3206]|uniref:stage V sporulation protein AB n=1 Tax=Anaerosalibacter sp. Marseille-P3206 TaxID=1871005 RepID=UPI0013563A0B|nr:stage V sporulation protein AB [Anaerosalibacter sp. Marseille-P3206]
MLKSIVLIAIGTSAGVIVGNAVAAFITLLQIIPRLIQNSDTLLYIKWYERTLILSMTLFSLAYFTNFSLKLPIYFTVILGIFFGAFIGIFSSALAEVLNVIPVLTKKLELEDYVFYLLIAIGLGKVSGSLMNWLVLVKIK